jgi:hypothetical protein
MPSADIRLTDRIRANDSIPNAEIDGELVLINIEKGRYYSLDDIGTTVFNRIRANRRTNAILNRTTQDMTQPFVVLRGSARRSTRIFAGRQKS